MAHQLKTPDGRTLFNIDSAVGFGGANRTDDVMLVQVLLRLWGGEHSGPPTARTPRDGRATSPQEAMTPVRHMFKGVGAIFQNFLPAVDGNCDGVTRTWIMMFQMCHNDVIRTVDGRVDTILRAQTNVSGVTNTMMLLNDVLNGQGYRGELPQGAPTSLFQATRTVRS